MYLNEFEIDQINEVIEIIKNKNIKDLIIKDWRRNSNANKASLCYIPYFHRVDINEFKSPLYDNPDAIVELYPRNKFIESLQPSEMYHIIMKEK